MQFGLEHVIKFDLNNVFFESDYLIAVNHLSKDLNNLSRFGSVFFFIYFGIL